MADVPFRAAEVAALLVLGVTSPLAAQIDYRNLDDHRPTRVEDAYPAERYALELIAPYSLERERGGRWLHAVDLEAEYGGVLNAQIGVAVPVAGATGEGWGLSGLRVFMLYNFNTEGPLLPAMSLRADVQLPVGSLADDHVRVTGKGILTRSWGRQRVHLNAGYSLGEDTAPAAVDHADLWWVGAALDHTLYRQSVLAVGEVFVEQTSRGVPVEVNATLGLRWQWRPTTVLDLGVGRGLRPGVGPELSLTIGLTNAFGLVP